MTTSAMTWSLIVQLYTGQVVAIDMETEDKCEVALTTSKIPGKQMTIIVQGVKMPVAMTFGCVMRRLKDGEQGVS